MNKFEHHWVIRCKSPTSKKYTYINIGADSVKEVLTVLKNFKKTHPGHYDYSIIKKEMRPSSIKVEIVKS